MATVDSVKAKIQGLIDFFNEASGGNETTLTGAIVRFLFAIDQTGKEPVLESLAVTENGTYTPYDGVAGYNQVEVNVDTQSYYDQGYTDGENSVDTSMYYNDGYNMGYADGQSSVDTQSCYDQGYADGVSSIDTETPYNTGYSTGYSDGYSEGYEAGRNSVETA